MKINTLNRTYSQLANISLPECYRQALPLSIARSRADAFHKSECTTKIVNNCHRQCSSTHPIQLSTMAITILALLFTVNTANADTSTDKNSPPTLSTFFNKDGWIIGLNTSYSTTPYVDSNSHKIEHSPYIAWNKGPLHIGLDRISYSFQLGNNLKIDAMAEPKTTPFQSNNSALFQNINRDDSVEVGFRATLASDIFYTSVTALTDVSSVHNGHRFTGIIGAQLLFSDLFIDIGGGINVLSKELDQYLFGLSSDQTISGNQTFSPNGQSQTFAKLLLAHPISKNTALVGSLNVIRLEDDAYMSPLVENKAYGKAEISIFFRY